MTAGEAAVARGILALEGVPSFRWVRLVRRVGSTFRVARLEAGPLLVEVKGPGDSIRDGQGMWFDRLRSAGVAVDLWKVVSCEDQWRQVEGPQD